MPINFPNTPTPNQLYTYDDKTWEWNGIYWEVYSALTSYVSSITFNSYTGVTQPLIYSSITGGTYSGGTLYLKNNSGSTIQITGFTAGGLSGDYLPLSGGTVSGGTRFTSGLSANTISATTYFNLPVDVFVTGGTYTNGEITFRNITGGTFTVSGLPIGGSGGQVYYFNLSNTQSPYREFSPISTNVVEQSTGTTIGAGATSTIVSFQTPTGYPNVNLIPAGYWSFYLHSYKGNTNATFNIFCEVYLRTTGGTETLLVSTDPAPVLANSPTPLMQLTDGYYSGSSINTSDRIVVKVRATNTSSQSQTITFFTEGTQHYSYGITPFTNNTGLNCGNLSGCSIIQNIQTDISNKFDKSGGTISGNVLIQSGLTATTISATTYLNLPLDFFVTGGTYSGGTLFLVNNSGNTLQITGFSNLEYFVTGSTPSGVTLNSGDRWFNTTTGEELVWINDGNSSQWLQICCGGGGGSVNNDYLSLSGGTVTGATNFTGGLTANTISATTYLGNVITGVTSVGSGTSIYDSTSISTANIRSITSDTTNKVAVSLNSQTINLGVNEQNLTLWNLVVQGNKLLNGSVSYVSGLTFSVSPLEYLINGVIYNITGQTTVTLTSGNSTFDRIDVIFADISGNTGVLSGIPSANPEKPLVNGDTQVEVTFVLVPANSTSANVGSFTIYNENSGPPTEWRFSTGGTQSNRIIGNFTDTTYSGGTSIRVSGITGTTYTTFFTLSGASQLNTNNYPSLQFAIRNLSANTTTSQIRFRFLTSTGTQNGSTVFMNGAGTTNFIQYSPTNVSTWQLISIPIWRFYLTNTNVEVLEVAFNPGTGTQSRYLFDTFQFISGLATTPPANAWTVIQTETTGSTVTPPSPNATLTMTGGTNIQVQAPSGSTSLVVIDTRPNIRLSGLSATTISATTYQNLPPQVNNSGIIYGDGFDGTIILNGTNTYSSFTTYASATTTYTLTRSIYPNSLSISSGITLNTNGYMITCKGDMTISGTCGSIGNSGGTAVNVFNNYSTAGTGAASLKPNNNITDQILVPPNIAGGNGSNAVPGGWGSAGGSISITTLSYGALGGGGGRGYDATQTAGPNSTVSFGAGGKFIPYSSFNPTTSNHIGLIGGAITAGAFVAAPGGGGGAGGQAGGGWGGAGGGGGGAPFGVKILASTLTITSTGLLRSNGGNGGNGCPGSLSNWTHGAGGGGGGGGIIYIITNNLNYSPNNRIQAKGGTGGTGGFGVGSGASLYSTDGSNGADGFIHIQNTSTGIATFYTGQY